MPPPDICDWAEDNIHLPPDISARPGLVVLDAYQKDMLRAMVDADLRNVAVMAPSQTTGKTLMFAIAMLYRMAHRPGPMFFMHATQDGIRKFVREKMDPMLKRNADLNRLITTRNNRGDLGLEGFGFTGGYVTMTTARSISGRHGTTAAMVIADEVDDYGLDLDISDLAQRMASFDGSMMVTVSTPTIKGASPIASMYERGSQEEWHVVCPACGAAQVMAPDGIDWLARAYRCIHCGEAWTEGMRRRAIRAGFWVTDRTIGDRRSFHMTQLASRNCRLETTLDALETYSDRSRTTQVLALPYEDVAMPVLDAGAIVREAAAPFQVAWRSVGVDIQKDRIEASVVAFSRTMDRQHLERHIMLDRSRDESCFRRLRDELKGTGYQKITVDGGYNYDWVSQSLERVYGNLMLGRQPRCEIVRGFTGDSFGKPLRTGKPSRPKGKGYYMGATDEAKRLIMQALLDGEFTVATGITDGQLRQLTSERLVVSEGAMATNGLRKRKLAWILEPGRRNEVLDCVVYAWIGIIDVASRPPAGIKTKAV